MTADPKTMTRRQLIRHTAWFGAAVGFAVVGGEVISHVAGASAAEHTQARPTLRFAQVSDSHIGFTGAPNPDVTGTFGHAIDQINNLGYTPDFVIHTGDLTHLSTPGQFDQVKQMMSGLKTPHVFTVPGEHDSVDDAGQKYRSAFGAGTRGRRVVQLRHRRRPRDRPGQYLEPEANLGIWASTSWSSSRRMSRGCRAIPPSSCSATSRCSRCTRTGAGAPTMPPRRSATCAGSHR